MKKLIVHKYGGSSLSNPDKILAIAKHLGELYDQNNSLIVVVSAMGSGTDKLISLAHQISKTPARREMDMLLSTGERVSMSLMSMALQSLGYPAISFTGSQSGIFTNSTHNKARITDVRPIRIEEALKENKIVIVAGFQGVDPDTKEITTLGRGGSDTTAVSLATYFKANICKTLKDVDGVFDSDPKLNKNSNQFKTINFKTLKNMCFWGSPILHYRSVALAEKMNIPLFIGNSTNINQGTNVNNKDLDMYEQTQIIAINCIDQIFHISIKSSDTSEGYIVLNNFLTKNNFATPQILASAYDKDYLRVMFSDSQEALSAIETLIPGDDNISLMKNDNSAVTLTFNGAVDFNIINQATNLLKNKSIAVSKVLSSPTSLSFIVNSINKSEAITTLQSLISN